MIRILHLEDNPNDAAFVRAMLAEEGLPCEITRVGSRRDFDAALNRRECDLIISDFTLPSYDGRTALLLARKKCPNAPFIFFSGAIGEETAVEALKAGATDCVLKPQAGRLVSAVRRALREVEEQAERKQLEEQFRQAQKMEAIGQLTGGIAHDFNNMLTVINGYSEMTLQLLKADDPLRSNLKQIKEAVERAAALTRRLLAFSRKQVLEPRVLDLNAVVTNIEKMLTRTIGEDIALTASLTPGLGRVKADPGQIEQVLMNLAVNARDAMPQGGKLAIETANVELDENYARGYTVVRPGLYVMLAVSDTGCGMDAETQRHIFEPFFTTKEPGKGTGLGLATVYGIVKQSGGFIWVSSEVGKGTTFKMYLPRVEEEPDAVLPCAVRAASQKGAETILLVEDDEPLRKLTLAILQHGGYYVLTAADREEALRLCGRHQEPIHLLLADVVMPGMSERELMARLPALHPETKILYMSGYTHDTIVRRGVLNEGLAFLQKPFTTDSLLCKVREILDAAK